MSSEHIDDGGPAFPVADSHYPNGQVQFGDPGMSLRDYFAAQAPHEEVNGMIGERTIDVASFIGIPVDQYDGRKHWIQALAKARYIWADAMIAARKAGAQ